MNLLKIFKAIGSAFYALVRARDVTKEPCPRGHVQQVEWQNCPVCAVIDNMKGLDAKAELTPVIALRILDGREELRSLLLPVGEYTLGNHVTCDIVITPKNNTGSQGLDKFQLMVAADSVHLRATRGSRLFRIGNDEYKDSQLFDRDRFSLLGGDIEMLSLIGDSHV